MAARIKIKSQTIERHLSYFLSKAKDAIAISESKIDEINDLRKKIIGLSNLKDFVANASFFSATTFSNVPAQYQEASDLIEMANMAIDNIVEIEKEEMTLIKNPPMMGINYYIERIDTVLSYTKAYLKTLEDRSQPK